MTTIHILIITIVLVIIPSIYFLSIFSYDVNVHDIPNIYLLHCNFDLFNILKFFFHISLRILKFGLEGFDISLQFQCLPYWYLMVHHNLMNPYVYLMLGMILRPIVMIGIWIVVIYGMTTTFIFYLITLIHFCREHQCPTSGASYDYQHLAYIFYNGIVPSRFNFDLLPLCGWILLFGSTW